MSFWSNLDPTNKNSYVRRGARAFDPTTGDGLANLATGGLYGMNRSLLGGGFGGGGGKNGAPDTPDFTGAANDQTRANRPDQSNPFSSSTWTQNEDGSWSQNVTLTPGLQDAAQSITAGLGSQLNPAQAREQAIQAAYGQATSRLDPQWAQRESSQRTSLLNQGLTEGSQAYDTAMANTGRERNDAYAQALYNAQTGAGNAAFQQALGANMQPYQQLNMLKGLTSQNSYGQAADLVGALGNQYQGQLNQYATDQAGKNSMMSGLSGLGTAAMFASDEALKQDIVRHGVEVIPGVPLASWEWRADPGRRHWGVIAQDVEKVRPDLVHMHPAGFRMVNYGGLR